MRVIASGLIVLILLVGLGMAGAGCVSTEAKTGTIEVLVTNTPTEKEVSDTPTEFEISSIIATVSEIKICKAETEQEGEGEQEEWINLNITVTSPFDLLQLVDLERVLALGEVEACSYSQILMVIDRLDVTLNDGSEMVIIPEEPFEFIGEFMVIADETTTVLFDFDIDKSVVIEEDKATINPISGITMKVRYEESESE